MGSSQLKLGRTTTMKFWLPLPWLLWEWLLSPDSIEDMLDIMEATVAMEDTMVDILVDTMAMVAMEAMYITSARDLLTLRLSLDSVEDTEDMEAMDITLARGLLTLTLNLDSIEDM